MGKILPIILALLGLGAGVGGGIALRPELAMVAEESPCGANSEAHADTAENEEHPEDGTTGYVKLNNQFVIPVVNDGNVTALVVTALSIELNSGGPELVYEKEPKLRDGFLQVLFNHANTGGFDGNFTAGRNMEQLRSALRESAQKILGPAVTDVLIVDILRQDT